MKRKIDSSSVQKGYWKQVYKNLNSLDLKGLEKLEKNYGVVWYGEKVNNVEKCDRNINHPFEEFIHVKSAQNAFQEASKGNDYWTSEIDNKCHLKYGRVVEAFTKEFIKYLTDNFDIIVTDSGTCSAEGDEWWNRDKKGQEFNSELYNNYY